MNSLKPQIFLLPFAGGNRYSYSFLNEYFSDKYDYITLELPGRGKRFKEKLLFSNSEAVDDYLHQIIALRNKNVKFMLFGHSMGGLLSFFVGKELIRLDDSPIGLILSGCLPPSRGNVFEYQTNDEIYDKIVRLGGTQLKILENKDFCNLYFPIIQADFCIVNQILEKDVKGKGINIPIYVLMGSEEDTTYVSEWGSYTISDVYIQIVDGNHFFIFNHPELIKKEIDECYDRCVVH